MSRSGISRVLIICALGAVVALSLAAVRSTGALWTDQTAAAATNATIGKLSLMAGSGSGSTLQFPGLNGTNVVPGQQSQAKLDIVNDGDTPLRYRLTAGGPDASPPGSVTVALSGSVMAAGQSCGTGALPGVSAFTSFTATSSGTAAVGPWRSLAKKASESWCIRSVLQSVTAIGSASYTVLFTFGTEQTRS